MSRRALAIERYIGNRGNRDDARRAARVLEAAVGEALGEAPGQGARTDLTSARGPKLLIGERELPKFRLMAAHADRWMPKLEERALSRKQVLFIIEQALRPRPAARFLQVVHGHVGRLPTSQAPDVRA